MLKKGQKLVVASHNEGKVREIRVLLEPFGLDVVSAGSLGLPEPDETGSTFAANAALKADAASSLSGFASLSDDSGLCVTGLDGAPGIYSARWAGETKDFSLAITRIETELKQKNTSDRRAFFICALALSLPGEETKIFEGRVDGTLVFPPRGLNGFGYDPIFIPEGRVETFGEMDADAKHAISHRARAFEKFMKTALIP